MGTANDKMKVIFVFALFFASALCEPKASTSVVGPAHIVHAYTKFTDNSAHASVKAQAPKREAKQIELSKAGKDIDLTAFGITPPKPISVSATASASFKHVVPHPIIHKIIPAPIAC